MARTAPRLYLDEHWDRGARISLTPERSHYLSAVLRAQPGTEVRLFNSTLGEWTTIIAGLDKRAVTLETVAQVRPPQPEPEQHLMFAPIKKAPLEWMVEKATELGVTRFIPVLTERTQNRAVNLDRLQAISVEAAEQCERLTVPHFDEARTLPMALAQWPTHITLHIALERDLSPLGEAADLQAIAIGPEGGFSDAERALLLRQSFVRPFSLGPLILRAETAAIAALSWAGYLRTKA